MRARGMTAKLDRLPISEEVKVWDLSLLSPEDQDRAKDLMDLIQGSTDIEAEGLKAAIIEFENLVEGLPLLGGNDRGQGPKIEVPRSLAACQHVTCQKKLHFLWKSVLTLIECQHLIRFSLQHSVCSRYFTTTLSNAGPSAYCVV